MHLRALRLRGFKSFAEPVELRFEPGVAVVVGPNGSGKSNIAEAAAWAMASQPPSEMRAQTTADVVFAGSAQRPPSAVCEVELILDNADGGFGSGRPEISVMRRVVRDGDATYLLNRVAVRRLDVQEALADAGLGRELHAIVSQGRVEEILLSSSTQRRGYIEEAAGLGKYKRRRSRSLIKLGHVERNLERVRDQERELRARLRPLAAQASSAERAAALAAEADRARLELAGSRIAALRRQRAAAYEGTTAARAASDAVEEALVEAQSSRAAVEAELTGMVAAQDRASARYVSTARAGDRLHARRQALADRRAALADDQARARARVERLIAAAAAHADGAAKLAEEAEALLDADHEPHVDDATLAALGAETQAALRDMLAARGELADIDARLARLEGEAQEDAARADEDAPRISRAELLLAGAESDLVDATTRCAMATQEAAAAEAAYAASRNQRDESRHRVGRAREDADQAQRRTAAATARADAAEARLAAIREALTRHDGLDPALRRLHQRGVTQAAAFVADAASHQLAVAAALWWLVGQAVADTSSEAVALLGDDELAGAALGCLDRMTPRAEPDRGQPLGALVRLAVDAPSTLLDGVNLVLDPAELSLVRRGIAVAPDGRGFDADRGVAFRVGASAVRQVALRAEHDAAVAARAGAEPEVTAAAASQAEAVALLQRAEHEHDAAEASVNVTAEAAEAARDAASTAQRELAFAQREADRRREALQAIRSQAQARSVRRASASRDHETLRVTRGEAHERLAAVSAAYEACEARRVEAADRLSAWRAQRAAAHERLVRISTDRERHADAQRHCRARAAALHAALTRFDAVCGLVEPLGVALDHATQQAAAIQAEHEAAVAGLEQRAATLAASLSAYTEREQALQRDARQLAEARTSAEVSQAQVEERLAETLRQRRLLAQQASVEPLDRVEPLTQEEEAALEARIERLDRRREALGAVNPLAQAEYEETRERHAATAEQIRDAEASLRELGRLIDELTATIAERFLSTFALVEANFDAVVQTLFPAGRGRVSLSEPEADSDADTGVETPEAGVELEVSPAGKRITKLALLSGGEKSLAAIAFLFSIMLARPCPFYMLDEVDAALDDTNVERFLSLVDQYRDRAQFIIITHQKRTMEAADVLYGVTMAGDAVSRVVSRRLPREPVAAGA